MWSIYIQLRVMIKIIQTWKLTFDSSKAMRSTIYVNVGRRLIAIMETYSNKNTSFSSFQTVTQKQISCYIFIYIYTLLYIHIRICIFIYFDILHFYISIYIFTFFYIHIHILPFYILFIQVFIKYLSRRNIFNGKNLKFFPR